MARPLCSKCATCCVLSGTLRWVPDDEPFMKLGPYFASLKSLQTGSFPLGLGLRFGVEVIDRLPRLQLSKNGGPPNNKQKWDPSPPKRSPKQNGKRSVEGFLNLSLGKHTQILVCGK